MIRLITVDLGVRKIQVPVTELVGKQPGKTLLLTAGMDGDEYASIDAAYELIEEFSRRQDIHGNVITIPIVNIPGFEAKRDFNILDGKFPKSIFPGKDNGGPTERLIHWLFKNHISCTDVWIDLHGGALGEKLTPFVYMPQTGRKDLDEKYQSILSFIPSPKILFDRHSQWSFRRLHKLEKLYIRSEAGYSSDRSRSYINYHKKVVLALMRYLKMIQGVSRKVNSLPVYSSIETYKAHMNGLWFPRPNSYETIKKGQLLGTVQSMDGKKIQEVISQVDGAYLWLKTAMSCIKGEMLIEIGTEKVTVSELLKQI